MRAVSIIKTESARRTYGFQNNLNKTFMKSIFVFFGWVSNSFSNTAPNFSEPKCLTIS